MRMVRNLSDSRLFSLSQIPITSAHETGEIEKGSESGTDLHVNQRFIRKRKEKTCTNSADCTSNGPHVIESAAFLTFVREFHSQLPKAESLVTVVSKRYVSYVLRYVSNWLPASL